MQRTARKLIFSADLHGNLLQYQKLINHAHTVQADAILIGGDLFPKSSKPKGGAIGKIVNNISHTLNSYSEEGNTKTVAYQLQFFKNDMVPLLTQSQFNKQIPVFITLGNADFYANIDALKSEAPKHVHVLYNEHYCDFLHRADDDNNSAFTFDLITYSGVPFTSHRLKDQERFDLKNFDDATADRSDARYSGYVSIPQSHFAQYGITESMLKHVDKQDAKNPYGSGAVSLKFPVKDKEFVAKFSIENELTQVLNKYHSNQQQQQLKLQQQQQQAKGSNNNSRYQIWMVHGPPYKTCLDFLKTKQHCGSEAVLRLIKQYSPLLTLHGHIHETVDMSNGKYVENIVNSAKNVSQQVLSATAGNYPGSTKLACLVVQIESTIGADNVATPKVEAIHRVLV